MDMQEVTEQISGVLKASPNAGIMLRMHMNPPVWWMRTNPGETVVYAEGPAEDEGIAERLIARDCDRVMRVSLASRKWLNDAETILFKLCRTLAEMPEGRHVIAIQAACGIYGEWHHWGHGADYSRPMQLRFQHYLRDCYGTDEALRQAWGNPLVKIESAEMADMTMRTDSADGLFFDPISGRRAIDTLKTMQAAVADAILHFCRVIKESWPRPVLAGVFYGYFFGMGGATASCGHTEMQRIFSSPSVDFLCGPHSYYEANRELGGLGAARALLESCRIHGKLWLTEMDERPIGVARFHAGDPQRHRETIAIMRRNILNPIQHGMGFWYYDHRVVPDGDLYHKTGWWDHPVLLSEIRREYDLYQKYFRKPFVPVSDVLFVYDCESYFHLTTNVSANPLDRYLIDDLQQQSGHTGAALDCIYLFDLERMDLTRFRVIVFVNTFVINQRLRKFIRQRAATENRHLVWLYAPGYSDGTRLSADLICDITTIQVQQGKPENEMIFSGSGFPKTNILLKETQTPCFSVNDPEAETVATFRVSGKSAAAVKKHSHATDWFFSLPPCSPVILRELFRQAGAHLYNEDGDALSCGGGLLSIHTVSGGPRKVTLRDGRTLELRLQPASTTVIDTDSGDVLFDPS